MRVVSLITEQRFTKQVGLTLITQVISVLISVSTAAIIARWLGPEGKGTLTLALLVPGMLVLILSGGIGIANVYFAGSKRLTVSTLTGNSLSFTLMATTLALIIVVGLSVTKLLETIIPGIPDWILLIAMLGFPTALLSRFFSSILQGLQRIATINVINLIQSILTLSLTAVFVVVWKLNLLGALVAPLAAGVLSLIFLCAILRQEGGVFRPLWKYTVVRSTLSFGLRGHIGNLLQFFNYRLDMFILNYFLGPANVGIYIVSVRLVELLWHLPNSVSFVIFPKAAATRPEEMNAFTPRVFGITLGLTALGALGLALVGRPIINFVFSSAFISAYVPMLVLLPGVVLLGGAKVLTNEIAGRGYPHYNSVNAGLALVLTVVLDLVLIPRYSVLGAALASSIAYTAIFLASIGFYLAVSRKAKAQSCIDFSTI
jgi:O-antigen/teichoic acid export membrane protein